MAKEKVIKEEKPLYKFRCLYQPTLFIGELGLMFKDGYLEVSDEKHAEYIRKLYGVEEVK